MKKRTILVSLRSHGPGYVARFAENPIICESGDDPYEVVKRVLRDLKLFGSKSDQYEMSDRWEDYNILMLPPTKRF